MNSHSFERFVLHGGKLEKSLADSMSELKISAALSSPCSQKEYDVSLSGAGRYLLCIEYFSNEAEISQMPVNILVDGKSAATITVNGTGGTSLYAYRDISVINGDIKLLVQYPETLVTINKIEFMN
jgi:hypothetical protein